MLLYNISYHLTDELENNFVIWVKEVLIPQIQEQGILKNPRFCKILSHQQPGELSYSLQWEVANSTELHKWHIKFGNFFSDELNKIFHKEILYFESLMRIVE